MKRALSFLFPTIAVLGCGRVSWRIVNFLLSVTFGILLMSAVALSFTPLLEASGRMFFLLAGVFWLAASGHALSVAKRHSLETRSKEEAAQLMQQTELMKLAAARRNTARQHESGADASP